MLVFKVQFLAKVNIIYDPSKHLHLFNHLFILDVAIVTALFEVGVAVAGSIGSTIAGAVWNSVLPGLIHKYVPGEYNALTITKSIPKILALPEEQYNGVAQAYDEAMYILGIVAVCIGALAFLCSTQLKGYVLENVDPEQEEIEVQEIDSALG